MTATSRVTTVVNCDHDHCPAGMTVHGTITEARREAARLGWQVRVMPAGTGWPRHGQPTRDFCPSHKYRP